MKKIFFTFFMFLSFVGYALPTITKTASKTTARVGEVFEYTISISGITNLSELGKIEDALSPHLEYISSDFNTTSTVNSFYSLWCPGSVSGLIQPASGSTGTLVFQFPSGCGGSGSGDLSFKVKVAIRPSACDLSVGSIANMVILKNQSNNVIASSAISSVLVDRTNPWTLNKTFKSLTGGYLIYDIRLSSSVATYNTNVLPVGVFTDDFEVSACLPVDTLLSEVIYIPDEANPSVYTVVGGATTTSGGLQTNWSITTPAGGATPSSYLFQVRIKIGSCACPDPIDILNKVKFDGTDICGKSILLNSDFDLLGASCADGNLTPPEKAEVCVSKEVKLNDNNLNLTMSGCKGKYVITIKNCTSSYDYTNIKLTDVLPSTALLTYGATTVSPAIYSPDLTITGGTLSLISTTTLAPGGTITITVPFTVTTPLPDQLIKNCANIKVMLDNHITPSVEKIKNFCDIGIKTVPNGATVVTYKKICNPPLHSCGGTTINNNLPNDIVEYALHVYNYGTGLGTNFSITDQIPTNFNVLNPLTDIKVYKLSNYGNSIPDICDISAFTDITSSVIVNPIVANKLKINFGSTNNLDKFTCTGITHYVVKIKVKIASTTPNGSYTNAFKADFHDVGSSVNKTIYSNSVASIVNKDQLLFIKKNATKVSQDCVTKKAKVEYEIWAINMGTENVYINVDDVISVPSGLGIGSGINSLEYQLSPSVTWAPLISSGVTIVSNTTNTLTIKYLKIPACTLLKIRYKVVYNTNNINAGKVVNVCNKAIVTVGYLVNNNFDSYTDLAPSKVHSGAKSINEYFESKTDLEKYRVLEKMEPKKDVHGLLKPLFITDLIKFPQKFVAISRDTAMVCIPISDCLNGTSTGCFLSNNSNAATFTINSINSTGIANTTLTIPIGGSKVRKVEYILSDIRMLVNPCPPFQFCFNCNTNVTGNFNCLTPSPIGTLTNQFISSPTFASYREKNKVEFSNAGYQSIGGTHIKDFQLPISTLNCNGNLEIVITVVIFYEDCSVCYVSAARDYNAKYTWHLPLDFNLNSSKK